MQRLEAANREVSAQIGNGIALWRVAVTFHSDLILRAASSEARKARDEKAKIDRELQRLQSALNGPSAPQMVSKLKADIALWRQLREQWNNQMRERQQRVKEAVQQARLEKLNQYESISERLSEINPTSSAPWHELKYEPILRSASFMGEEFKFGRLAASGDRFPPGEQVSLPEVRAFIEEFRAKLPSIELFEATGSLSADDDIHKDEALTIQHNFPAPTAPAPRKRTSANDIPLP